MTAIGTAFFFSLTVPGQQDSLFPDEGNSEDGNFLGLSLAPADPSLSFADNGWQIFDFTDQPDQEGLIVASSSSCGNEQDNSGLNKLRARDPGSCANPLSSQSGLEINDLPEILSDELEETTDRVRYTCFSPYKEHLCCGRYSQSPISIDYSDILLSDFAECTPGKEIFIFSTAVDKYPAMSRLSPFCVSFFSPLAAVS